ncbi:hypothetical protein FO519_001727 [Halicephalobus sp. NKZ332]|nr:hypothetical protein FO519_001727 [Halicephalobus sp. NKZ332]
MPPARRKPTRKPTLDVSDSDSEDDGRYRRSNKRTRALQNVSAANTEHVPIGISPSDEFLTGEGEEIMKMASDVVDKGVKLHTVRLFDADVMDGFTMLMNCSKRVIEATKPMEAGTKVYTQRVDALYSGVQKTSSAMLKKDDKPKEQNKGKKVTFETWNDWLAEDEGTESAPPEGIFSADEDENQLTQLKTNMTVVEDFHHDQTMAPGCRELELSVDHGDDDLGQKINSLSKNRSLLTKGKLLTLEQLEMRFKRADEAVRKHNAVERCKFGASRQKKETITEEAADYTQLDFPLFSHALLEKRENVHIALDEVAENNHDCSLAFLHSHWREPDEGLPSMDQELEDWRIDEYNENINPDEDVALSVLEHLQGTMENSTAVEHKLPDELIEVIGLQRKDLKRVRDLRAYVNVSFEQTANASIDEEKMIDHQEIPEEVEVAAKELSRLNELVVELYKGRIELPECAQNPQETSIRQEMHRPKYAPCFDDEDRFFNFDFRKHITRDTVNLEISNASRIWIKSLRQETALSLGIVTALFSAMQTALSNPGVFSEDLQNAFKMIPDYVFGKLLLMHPDVGTNFMEEAKHLEGYLVPFRISRYAQYVVSSVIHEVQKGSLVMVDDIRNRPPSAMHLNSTIVPYKRARLDEAFSNRGPHDYLYFFAMERFPVKRYQEQEVHHNPGVIRENILKTLTSERAVATGRMNSDPAILDAFWALVTMVGFYAEHKNVDLTDTPVVDELPTLEEEGEEVVPMEVDQERIMDFLAQQPEVVQNDLDLHLDIPDMDDDHDFHTALHTPVEGPSLQDTMSQDLFQDTEPPKSNVENIVDFHDIIPDSNELNDSFALLVQDFHEPDDDDKGRRPAMCFRCDDQLTLTIPGFGDPSRMFVPAVYQPVKRALDSFAIFYRGEYCHLPPTAKTRQKNDMMFFVRYHKVLRDLEIAKQTERSGNLNNVPVGDESMDEEVYHDAYDSAIGKLNDVSLLSGEAGHMKQSVARESAKYPFKLKRTIKFILSRRHLDRSTIREDIKGLKPPNMIPEDFRTPKKPDRAGDANVLAASTPSMPVAKAGDNVQRFEYDEIIAFDLGVPEDHFEKEALEDIPRDETDETRMEDFKVQGFHTFRSVLYYLPKYCCADTIELLSAAHVFSIICHMSNENSLHMSQDMYDEEDVEERVDYLIENFADWQSRMLEQEMDDNPRLSDDD